MKTWPMKLVVAAVIVYMTVGTILLSVTLTLAYRSSSSVNNLDPSVVRRQPRSGLALTRPHGGQGTPLRCAQARHQFTEGNRRTRRRSSGLDCK